MGALWQDLRYALRQLRKSPGFTAAAVLTMSLGIGANTAIFSSMDAVVLRPLAVPDLDRVVTLGEQRDGGSAMRVRLANYEDWRQASRSFESMAAHTGRDMNMTGAGDAAQVRAELSEASFFTILRTRAVVGRVFNEEECQPGQDAVAVLSYGFWQRSFGSDPGVVGRRIELDQRVYSVIGVMPKGMEYPSTADLFLPLASTQQQLSNRTDRDYEVLGRLRPGVSVKQAQAEMRGIAAHLAAAYPATNQGWSVYVEPLLAGINGPYTPLYYRLILGATMVLLLVVCANVANLQFARGIRRRPEIAMRRALGAGRGRILRQLLTENILLGLAGAAGGVLFGGLYLHFTLITMPERVARYMSGWSHISIDGRALAFSVLLAVFAGVAAGLTPALDALKVNLVEQIKAGSRSTTGTGRSGRLRNVLAVVQIGMAVALVIGAALMAKGMTALLHSADPYRPGGTLTFNVALPAARYDTPQKQAAWYAASLDRVRALPGVKQAEISTALPWSDWAWLQDLEIENRPVVPGQVQNALRLTVSNGYFSEFHIAVEAGRGFNSGDTLQSVPVAVVSRRFVQHYLGGENPIGRKIRMGGAAGHEPWVTIVGVAAETSYSMWDDRPLAAVYLSQAQLPSPGATYAVIVNGDPLAIAPAVRKALAQLDPGLPLNAVETYRSLLNENLTGLMYAAAMLGVDALFALLLAAIGIFAVMTNQVGERTREIGVRLALGARREDVLRLILGKASRLALIGMGGGLLLAYALAHGVANLLRGVSANDPVVFAAITAAVAGIALGASWFPARRAARINPMDALHDE